MVPLVGMVDLAVTAVVLELPVHLDLVKIVGQVVQSIMMVIFQQLESCHLEKLVVK